MAPRHVIGLTGNIASGKSAVSAMLGEQGATIVDADLVARTVLDPGTEETAVVAARFGPSVIGPDGAIDRAALGRVVFADAQALADLEGIVHPAVRRRVRALIDGATVDVVVLEAIKLIEGPMLDWVDTIWVVTAPREVRVRRLLADRGMSREDAEQRVDAQNPEEEKVARADVVLVNDGTVADLREQVDVAWRPLSSSATPEP